MFIAILLIVAANFAVVTTSQKVQGSPITFPTEWPSVYVYPETVVADVGDLVNVSIVVFNLTDAKVPDPDNPILQRSLGNLYGFDIQLAWNSTILRYVSHTVTVPLESFPNPIPPSPYPGILHNPIFELVNQIDETASIPGSEPGTMAWVAYAAFPPAAVSNGNGTFLTMTFEVMQNGSSPVRFTGVALSDKDGNPLLFHRFDGEFRTTGAPVADFTFWPDVGVVNKLIIFNASSSYDPDGSIASYIWNFGDGNTTIVNTPIIQHNYTTVKDYTVSVTVKDSEGVFSSPKTETVRVAASRNVRIISVTLTPSDFVKLNKTVDVAAAVENNGFADENFTLTAYYNASVIDFGDIAAATWVKVGEKDVSLPYSGVGRIKTEHLTWNTTGVSQPEAYYHVLVNATMVPYEDNVNDSSRVSSDAVFITTFAVHDVSVETLQFGWNAPLTTVYKTPVLDGETTSFRVVVKNKGTEPETSIDVRLYRNSTLLRSWTSPLTPGSTAELKWQELLDVGVYNITAQAMVTDESNVSDNDMEQTLQVIGVPQLNFTLNPSRPVVNQTVVIDASSTTHGQPGANITEYRWEIWVVGETTWRNVTEGPDITSLSYKFTEDGEWRIILLVKDSYGIEYDRFRTATSAYRLQGQFDVSLPGGFPIEYIIAAILIVVVALAAVFVLLRRRRKKV